MRDVVSLKPTLAALFTTALVSANVLASKIVAVSVPMLGDAVIPAGFIAIAVAFLLSDTMAEIYGEEATRSVVNGSILGIVLFLGLAYASVVMPAAPFYENAEAFRTILLSSAPIAVASVTTLLLSQNLDVALFGAIKRATNDNHKWLRNVGSTVVSQLVDTSVFIVLGFVLLPQVLGGTVTPLSAVGSLIVSQYVVKVGVAVLDTPIFYAITSVLD